MPSDQRVESTNHDEVLNERGVYCFEKAGQFISYYGAFHTHLVEDPQLIEISSAFQDFCARSKGKKIVFVEGSVPKINLGDNYSDVVARHGERGYTTMLALKEGIEIRSLEPSTDEELYHLLRIFPPEIIEYYYFLRTVRNYYREGYPHGHSSIEDYAQSVLKQHKNRYGSRKEFSSLEFTFDEINKIHAWIFNTEFDWETRPDVDPNNTSTPIGKIAHEVSFYRDRIHIRNILEAIGQSYDVFVVNGAEHAKRQKRELEKIYLET